MKRVVCMLLALAGLGGRVVAATTATNDAPDFSEVRDLIRAHLSGVTDAELNRAAVQGLVSGLHGRVALGHDASGAAMGSTGVIISKTDVLDDGVAYVRVGHVADGLAKELSAAVQKAAAQQASASNHLKGLALDLRFAGGEDYGAAATTAELFQAKPRRLLDWNGKMVEAKGNKDALSFPVAVLVNGETGGAAEALAAVMRETGAGLLLGSRTSGSAAVMRDFTLKSGQHLEIASTAVKLGDGAVLSAEGVKPDIAVAVKPEDERAYFADAFANLGPTNLMLASWSNTNQNTSQVGGTNRPARKRMSEAELVRKHREGGDEDELPLVNAPDQDKPVLHDPVLARAVDLLKGLAVVRQAQAE